MMICTQLNNHYKKGLDSLPSKFWTGRNSPNLDHTLVLTEPLIAAIDNLDLDSPIESKLRSEKTPWDWQKPSLCCVSKLQFPWQFDVERKNMDTRIEISCVGKPGLLLSTVSTLEALGLEIQQCVISCFNDFAMQATCSEVQTIALVVICF